MEMTVQKAFAHTIINEHARRLYIKGDDTVHRDFSSKFWKLLLVAYGPRFYDLPQELDIPTLYPSLPNKHSFPALAVPYLLQTGIPPTQFYEFKTITQHMSQYTPLHVGTALHLFGNDVEQAEARKIMNVPFLRKAYKNTSAVFVQNIVHNPYKPADVGMKPFSFEELHSSTREPYVVDELGNSPWFPEEYLRAVLQAMEHAFWYGALCVSSRFHNMHHQLVRETGSRLLRTSHTTARLSEYKSRANYLRSATPEAARSYLQALTGVAVITRVVRKDATAEDMAKGFTTLFSHHNARSEEILKYVGRPLAIDDFKAMTPKQALNTLYFSHFDSVSDVIKTHSQDLSAMFFSLSGTQLNMITQCMSPHTSRAKVWFPDTIQGNWAMGGRNPSEMKSNWDNNMRTLTQRHVSVRRWRDEFIQLAPPEVLFLALLRWAQPEAIDPIPGAAIDTVLRSVSNIIEIQNVIKVIPQDLVALR